MAARPRAPVAGPGVWSWLGLWLPAGGALGCLAGPAERQSASLAPWVRLGWRQVPGPDECVLNRQTGPAGVKYRPYNSSTLPKAPRACLLKCEGPGALCFAPQKRNAQYQSP